MDMERREREYNQICLYNIQYKEELMFTFLTQERIKGLPCSVLYAPTPTLILDGSGSALKREFT